MSDRNYGCRIMNDVTIRGNQAIVMENQLLRLTILIDRGTDIIELLYKPEDIDFMWRSPVALHKRADYISNNGSSLGNYLDHNSGGWQEILPNGGAECTYKGACLGMHGEISHVPWQYRILLDDPAEIAVEFTIMTLRSPFLLKKCIRLKERESIVYLEEQLTNLAMEPMELMWGHHPVVGAPFLDEHCAIRTNAKRAFTYGRQDFETQRLQGNTEFQWPFGVDRKGNVIDFSKIPESGNQTADMLYLTEFEERAYYRICHEKRKLSIGMEWDADQFPYLWMWLVCQGAYGYPWYGRTYNLALEPWSSYSDCGLTGAIQNGSSRKLEAQETVDTSLSLFIQKEKE